MKFEKGQHVGYVADIGVGGEANVTQIVYAVTERTISFEDRLSVFGHHARLDRTTYTENMLRFRVGETPQEALRGAIREREAEIRTHAIAAKATEQRLDREIAKLKAKLRSDL